MTDHFATNVHALLNVTKGYDGETSPEPSDALSTGPGPPKEMSCG